MERTSLPPAGDVPVVIGTLAPQQFAAGIQELPFVTNHGYENPAESTLRDTTLLALLAASAIAGLWWKPKVWLICALFFYVPYVLLYTTFFTNTHGLFSGPSATAAGLLAGAAGREARKPAGLLLGLVTPLYEFMTLLLTLAGAWWIGRRAISACWLLLWCGAPFPGCARGREDAMARGAYCPALGDLAVAFCWRRAVDGLEF